MVFDQHEHFVKMTDRNRYRVAGSNNAILLTVPMVNGRDQRIAMSDVQIDNSNSWQVHHWRTIRSVYGRAPFFFHYEPLLQALYEKQYSSLVAFNTETVGWVKRQLGLRYQEEFASGFLKNYPAGVNDIRSLKTIPVCSATYYQVFADRLGFLPGLSILDLLFSEGPQAGAWLKNL